MKQIPIALLLLQLIAGVLGARLTETVTVRAGDRAVMPCPGLSDNSAPGGYIINQLLWRCSGRKHCPAADDEGRLVEYVARTVRVHGSSSRLGLDRSTWSLVISPVEAADSATYSCFFNSQADLRLVHLVVQDVPMQPGRPMALRSTSRQVTLSWVPSFQLNNSPIEHYLIQTRRGEAGGWPSDEPRRTNGAVTTANVTGLTPFTVYTFRVISVNGLGRSEPSEPSYPVHTLREEPGGAPTLTRARSVSSTSVEVSWEPPPNSTIHGEFTGYILTYQRQQPGRRPGLLNKLPLRDITAKSRVIDNLRPYTQYRVTLQVMNPAGLGPAANITAVTGEGVPSRPENITFSDVSDRSVTVTWQRPQRIHGRLLGHTVYWAASDGVTSSRNVTTPHATSCTIDGLEPDQKYRVWLRAFTGAGPGQPSLSVGWRTDVSGPSRPVVTDITCPTDTALHLRWRRPDTFYRSLDHYYVLHRHDQAREFTELMVPATAEQVRSMVRLTNLTRGHVYEVRIQGATVSRLTRDKVYRGELSAPRKVRVEEGCQELQPVGTWSQLETPLVTGAQLSAVLVSCVLLTALIAAALFWRRRRHLRQLWKPPAAGGSPTDGSQAGWSSPPHHAVPSHVFPQAMHELHADGAAGFRREWAQLRVPGEDAVAAARADKHSDKTSTAAHYQQTRLSVSSRQYRSRPQLNTYLVDGYRRAGAFVVSERPRPDCHDALWQLVWERHIRTVVLVGSMQEEGEQPWPEPGSTRTFTSLEVQTRSQHVFATFTVRRLGLSRTKSQSKKKRPREAHVKLFQYTCWPAYGLSDDPLPLLEFTHQTLQPDDELNSGPVMVLAGTSPGSAAVYVVLVTLLAQLRHRQELSVLSYWRHALDQCPLFLVTLEEYMYVHSCLLERVMSGETLVPRNQLRQFLEQLQGDCRNSFPYPAAEKQYKHVIALEAHQFAVVSAARPCNQAKNRSLSSIPMEPSRVCLTPRLSQEGSDYINASWLPGFRHLGEFILTQHPLPKTVVDFWQMLWENRVTTVACLTSEDCGSFWPREEEEVLDCDGFMVRFLSQAAGCSTSYKTSWVVRTLLMESAEGDVDLLVRLVHLPLWPEESSTDSVMEGVEAVTEIHGDRLSPLVVIDRNGGTEGVTFCVLSTVQRQLQYQPQFDIFTYAKLYHQRRPGCWRTMREYLALYQVVEAWLPEEVESEHPASLSERQSWARSLTRAPLEAKLNGVHGVMV